MKPDVVYPKLEFSTAASFFKELEAKLPTLKVPVWKDELYFGIPPRSADHSG